MNSSWYRFKSTMREFKTDEKRKKKILKGHQEVISEYENNENKVLEILRKIHNNEEVKIPLVAFDYIYRNINKISMVDSEGRIVIVNEEKFIKFQSKAMLLLEKEKELNSENEKEQITEENEPLKLNTFETHNDGTIVKKNKIKNEIELLNQVAKDMFKMQIQIN